jgi:hypothetical protein
MAYREPPCTFCDEMSTRHCPRCSCMVCDQHWTEDGWCSVCGQELVDEQEMARFSTRMYTIEQEKPDEEPVINSVLRLAGDLRARLAKRRFMKRSRSDIERWRKLAKIKLRGDT